MTKILVVDDTPEFRDPIAISLRRAGFETLCASNGQEALAAIEAHRPSVVLLDLSMPVMDGLTCLRILRADPVVGKTPVILFTAASNKRHVIEAGALGVHDYLLKSSFSLKELLARVVRYAGMPVRPAAGGAPAKSADAPAPGAKPLPAGPTPVATPMADAAVSPPAHVASGIAPVQEISKLLTREECIARAEKALAAKTLSGAVAEVISMAASPRGNVLDLAPLIARDPMLSARVIQAANSAAYASTRGVVSTIADAVRQIGTSTVRSIAAAFGIFEGMPPSAADGFNPIRCWQHSFAVAMLCERLLPKERADDAGLAYLVGLCHDLGEILFHTHFGKECGLVLEAQRRTGRPMHEVECEMLGMSRGELVQTILQSFSLPDSIKEPIRSFHEGRVNPASPCANLTRMLQLAENYSNGLLLASSGGSVVSPITKAECRAALGRDDPKLPDSQTFRSEVFYTTGVLARLSNDQAEAVMKPIYQRSRAKICVVRDQTLSDFDPVTSALDLMADVKVVERLGALERGAFDGLVVLGASDLTGGFNASEVQQAASAPAADPTGAPRVLWLVGRINGMAQRDAPLAPLRWPVPLDDLARFVQDCTAEDAAPQPAMAA